MKKTGSTPVKIFIRGMSALAVAMTLLLGITTGAKADEADAKIILKSMSNYVEAQKAISYGFDATIEVVTKEDQKLALTSSGTLPLNQPDKIRVTRSGGFMNVEMSCECGVC